MARIDFEIYRGSIDSLPSAGKIPNESRVSTSGRVVEEDDGEGEEEQEEDWVRVARWRMYGGATRLPSERDDQREARRDLSLLMMAASKYLCGAPYALHHLSLCNTHS